MVKMVSADGAGKRFERPRPLPEPLDPCVLGDPAGWPGFAVRIRLMHPGCKRNVADRPAGPFCRPEIEPRQRCPGTDRRCEDPRMWLQGAAQVEVHKLIGQVEPVAGVVAARKAAERGETASPRHP